MRTRGVERHPAVAARAVEHREVELLVGRVEVGEEVEDLVQHVVVALVGAVDLVDGDDRAHAALQRLGDHELGLRQRAFGGVDQHDDAVDHVEDALDLAAEVGVARRVDDVDARVLPDDRRALGEDGDAALALEVVGVHRALATFWFSRKAPDCLSSSSTSVVLPWSTWAMIAMFRSFISHFVRCKRCADVAQNL